MLFSIVNDPAISANDLNHDLHIIQQWAYQWKMEFNPDPIKQATEVLFSCNKSSPNHPQLTFNGTAVAKVNDQKRLGLILDSRLSFEKHLNGKIIKAKKNVGILKHLSKFLPLKTLDQMYKVLVRSHLDYCDIIYHIPSHPKPSIPGCDPKFFNGKSRKNPVSSSPCHFWRLAWFKSFKTLRGIRTGNPIWSSYV